MDNLGLYLARMNYYTFSVLLFFRARLKNVDRSSATYHSVTVDDFTVVITEFKPKEKKEKVKKEKISNGNNNDSNDKKDKKEEFGQGPSRNGTNSSEHTSNNKDTKSKPGDSTGNGNFTEPTAKGGGGGGSSNANTSLNHENGVNSRATIDTSRSS
jgi:hypothetical protein